MDKIIQIHKDVLSIYDENGCGLMNQIKQKLEM